MIYRGCEFSQKSVKNRALSQLQMVDHLDPKGKNFSQSIGILLELLSKAKYSDNRHTGKRAPNTPLRTLGMSLYSAALNKRSVDTLRLERSAN